MARLLRLQGSGALAIIVVAFLVAASIPSSEAQTANTTTAAANSTVKASSPSPAKAPALSPKKAPAPAPKKSPPPPPYYPPSQYRKNAVYGLTFGGIGLCLSILGAVFVHDIVRKTGWFKPKSSPATEDLLPRGAGEFTAEDAARAGTEGHAKRYT